MARTGRRKGRPDTRETILRAAREAFAERGFDGASVRAIATSAGVDPALVYHYFATKNELFLAVVGAPIDPVGFIEDAAAGSENELGERLVRTFASVWGDPKFGPAVVAVLRSAIAHEWSARLLRDFATTQILRRIVANLNLPPDEAALRSALVASQMLGLGVTRYLFKLEPIASLDVDALVGVIGPTVQRYLTGELPASALPERSILH
jgi:AcrR family transcriptional regulator